VSKRRIAVAGILLGALLTISAFAEEQLGFLPMSGREILLKVLGICQKCDVLATLAGAKKTEEEWKNYLSSKGGLEGLNERQVKELITYMAFNFPLRNPTSGSPMKADSLPKGGKEILLTNCLGCHSVSVVALSEKPEAAWWNVLMRTDHAPVLEKLDEVEAKTLIAYLAINMPVPAQDIPEDLRVPSPGQG
jgi:mono/diheme cytochrome c family protein